MLVVMHLIWRWNTILMLCLFVKFGYKVEVMHHHHQLHLSASHGMMDFHVGLWYGFLDLTVVECESIIRKASWNLKLIK